MVAISEKLPVVIFHKDYPLTPDGCNAGAETASLSLARALAKLGYVTFLVADLPEEFCSFDSLSGHLHNDGVHYLNFSAEFQTGAAFEKIEKSVKLGRYHLIVASRAQALLESRHRPEIVSRLFIDHEQSPYDLGMSPEIIGHISDYFVCISQAQRETVIAAGCPLDRSVVVYNGVDTDVFCPADPISRDYKRLVFVGALVVDKGVHLLVEAFAKLKPHIPELTLDVYGSAKLWGRENYFDIDAAQTQLMGLRFHGAVPQQQLAAALATAGLMVVPSIIFDPFNLVSAEAQAMGLPVLASPRGGMKEFIEDGKTGRIIRDLSADGIAREIFELVQTPGLLQGYSQNCLQDRLHRFSWEKTAKELMILCERSAQGRTVGSHVLNL